MDKKQVIKKHSTMLIIFLFFSISLILFGGIAIVTNNDKLIDCCLYHNGIVKICSTFDFNCETECIVSGTSYTLNTLSETFRC